MDNSQTPPALDRDHSDRLTPIIEENFIKEVFQFDSVGQAVDAGIQSSDFLDPLFIKLWDALSELHDAGSSCDKIAVFLRLNNEKRINEIERDRILGLSDILSDSTGLFFPESIERLLKQSRKRNCKTLADRAGRYLADGNLDEAGKLIELAKEIDEQSGSIAKSKRSSPKIELGMENMPRSFEEAVKARPLVVVDGILYQGGKLLIGAAAKVGKSHFTMGLFRALALGGEFLKWRSACKLNVLYIDFELIEFELRERMASVFEYDEIPANVARLSLRKFSDVRDPQALGRVLEAVDVSKYDVVVFDCLYKFNDAEEENSNSAMKNVCSWLDGVAGKYDFAAIVIHHFGKGTQGGKSIADRFRGGSSLAGDFDAMLSITPHDEENHFIIESEVRSFKKTEPFVTRWDYPHFVVADDKDATAHAKPGAKRKASDSQLLEVLPIGEQNALLPRDIKHGYSDDSTFKRYAKDNDEIKVIKLKTDSGQPANHYYRSLR